MKSKIKNQKSKIAPPLILASASPRRAELLRQASYHFRVVPAPIAEPARRPASIPLELWPIALAYLKAAAVQQQLATDHGSTELAEVRPLTTPPVILAADTIVVLHGRILGKPRDRRHAGHMLRALSGTRHQVITGLALLRGPEYRFARAVSTCRIARLSEHAIRTYLDSGLWQGKAGAYGIQDDLPGGDPWVRLIAGEWSNVVGLPMKMLARVLSGWVGSPHLAGQCGLPSKSRLAALQRNACRAKTRHTRSTRVVPLG